MEFGRGFEEKPVFPGVTVIPQKYNLWPAFLFQSGVFTCAQEPFPKEPLSTGSEVTLRVGLVEQPCSPSLVLDQL